MPTKRFMLACMVLPIIHGLEQFQQLLWDLFFELSE